MSQSDHPFFANFFEDYLAECDEHLGTIRTQLLILESQIEQSTCTATSLQPLFRALHSLKGLSGMVGVDAAEILAHELENYLRYLRDLGVTLTAAGFEALLHGVTVLDEVMRACQQQTEMPDLEPVLAEIRAVSTPLRSQSLPLPPAAMSEADQQQIQTAHAQGDYLWTVMFTPSPARAEAGITVNRVRDLLSTQGTILVVTPQFSPDQGVTFQFIVATPVANAPLQWQLPGVTIQPYTTTTTPTPTTPTAPPSHPLPAVIANPLVRVDLHKLDAVLEHVGDLVMSRMQLSSQIQHLRGQVPTATWRHLDAINRTLEQQLRELRAGVLRVRLVPLTDTFKRLEFAARELARTLEKAVQVVIEGDGTELDKAVVDRMIDPLLHLVRNAVSHGIESVTERRTAAKPDVATLRLRATTAGERIVLDIEDDGVGIDPAAIVARSQALNLALPSPLTADFLDPNRLDPDQILLMLCAPGFSTQDQANLTSGRGVGMAIVRTTVQELGGHLSLQSTCGQGTQFRIELPLTLAITDALIVTVGDRPFAIPQVTLREIFTLTPQDRPAANAPALLPYRDGVLPLVALHRIFHLPPPCPDCKSVVIVVTVGTQTVGFLVDTVVSQAEIVVRPLHDPLVQVSGISGATALGDGRIVLILDVIALIHQTFRLTSDRSAAP